MKHDGARHDIIREWRSLPKEQRQTDEQAEAFAMQIKDKYKFRGGNADPYQTVKGWLQRHLSLTRGVGLTKGLKTKGNEPVRVAWGHHANDDKSPLMASAKKPNKEIPKNRNK